MSLMRNFIRSCLDTQPERTRPHRHRPTSYETTLDRVVPDRRRQPRMSRVRAAGTSPCQGYRRLPGAFRDQSQLDKLRSEADVDRDADQNSDQNRSEPVIDDSDESLEVGDAEHSNLKSRQSVSLEHCVTR